MTSSGVRIGILSPVSEEGVSPFSFPLSVSRSFWKLGKRFRYLMSMRSGGAAGSRVGAAVAEPAADGLGTTLEARMWSAAGNYEACGFRPVAEQATKIGFAMISLFARLPLSGLSAAGSRVRSGSCQAGDRDQGASLARVP